MTLMNQYLDAAKKILSLSTDGALAKHLTIHPQRLKDARDHNNVKNVRLIMQLSEILTLDPLAMLAALEQEWAKTPGERRWWKDFSERHRAAVVALGLSLSAVVSLFSGTADKARAGDWTRANETVKSDQRANLLTQNVICIMRNSENQSNQVPTFLPLAASSVARAAFSRAPANLFLTCTGFVS